MDVLSHQTLKKQNILKKLKENKPKTPIFSEIDSFKPKDIEKLQNMKELLLNQNEEIERLKQVSKEYEEMIRNLKFSIVKKIFLSIILLRIKKKVS